MLVKGRSGNKARDGNPLWLCKCECGKELAVRQSNLQNGWTRSCGCLRQPQNNLHYENGTCVEMLQPGIKYKSNTSGVRGVYYNKKRHKGIAQIMFQQKCYYLGGYDQIDDAAEAEEKNFGDFLKWYDTAYKNRKRIFGSTNALVRGRPLKPHTKCVSW